MWALFMAKETCSCKLVRPLLSVHVCVVLLLHHIRCHRHLLHLLTTFQAQ
jgi:hypothetical protein